MPLGNSNQVIVVANMGPDSFPSYDIPGWRWGASALAEIGYPNAAPSDDGSPQSFAKSVLSPRLYNLAAVSAALPPAYHCRA